MSSEAVGWVYRYSPYRGAAFQVHHAIADTANDQNANRFHMRLPKLALKARVDRGTVKRALDLMVNEGFLELLFQSSGGFGRPSEYRFLFPDVEVVFDTRDIATRAPRAGSDPGPVETAENPDPAGSRAPDAGDDGPTRAPRAGSSRAHDAGTRAPHNSSRVSGAGQRTQGNPSTSSSSSSEDRAPTDDDDDDRFDLDEALDGWLDVFATQQQRPVVRKSRWKATVLVNLDDDHPDLVAKLRDLAWRYPKANLRAVGRAAAGDTHALAGCPTRTDLCEHCDTDGLVEDPDTGQLHRCPACAPQKAAA